MHKSKLKGVALAVLLAFAPMASEAAGLGRLTVTSGLGEPLSAEIELLSTTPDELATLTAGIAPEEAYNVQGVERTAIHNAIKVDVSKRADGTPVLKLTTSQAISDPFLDMLIQVDWATGRLLREYTVLLDPPGYNNQAQVYNGVQLPPDAAPTTLPAPAAAPQQNPPPANTAPQSIPAPIQTQAAAVPEVPEQATQLQDASPQTYTTSTGDTLSAIAREHQVPGVSLDQMLVGLYRANEEAFIGKNMNRLKVGQIMRVPSPAELQQIAPAEARREVRVHTSDWNAYRNRLADLAAESTLSVDGGPQQSASGRISTPATDQAAPPADASRDVVRLSSDNASQAQLHAMQEELTAKDKSLKEAAERVAMLEKQIADMQKLLAIKNQALANLQNADVSSANPEESTLLPEGDAEPQVQAESDAAPTAAQASETDEPATDTASTGDVAEPVKPASQPAPVEPVVEEPSLFEELVGEDPLPLALAAGGIVLLLGGWLYMRNKRKRELDSFEKGIQTAGGLKPNTVFGNTAGATINTGDTSFLNDFSQNTGGMIDTHDVDPIAEAEVYMAYGRDAQAEEILKDAIVKEPQRHELHLKLLEIYVARNDTSAFETVAGEIYTTLGASDPIWNKVAEMGRKLEPDNPLYAEGSVADKPASSPVQDVKDAEPGKETTGTSQQAAFTSAALAGATIAVTGSLPDEKGAQDPAPDEASFAEANHDQEQAHDFPSLDFDLSAEDRESLQQPDVDAPDSYAGNSMDFTLDLPEPPAKNSLQLDIAELDAAIPDFDLPELPGSEKNEAADAVPAYAIPGGDEAAEQSSSESAPFHTPDVDLGLPEIALPEIELPNPAAEQPAVEEPVAQGGDMPDIDFDLPEISFDEEPHPEEAAQSAGLESLQPVDDALEAPETASASAIEKTQPDAAQPLDFADIDLETDDLGDNRVDATTDQDAEITFPDFDIELDESEPVPAADIDLSGISLDVAGDTAEAEKLVSGEGSEEPADVDTKLDLVTAYMDMGDNEGARELLEEILKEGGPRQQQRAKSILDSLS
ncbi:FimV/HubP family polar landmark protein [Methylobacillus flagellatus]|uniref:LysM domain-containing protein n=1 Tax=Methylobacillus flagellatus (strain ATCC 51484 / DSM 6875 / VKM B-1610 / KT) TaxID=265072 RepID=Q1H0L8_METFK|nr:FimV/HubP family polar landmark protein [Methylobacillus flagellatus]ABE49969.1 conserved hypothetical protein [Methylobacillus flagellatus KT]